MGEEDPQHTGVDMTDSCTSAGYSAHQLTSKRYRKLSVAWYKYEGS
jgi:hypothetical protein